MSDANHNILGIQYLRGIAALMVVATHAGLSIPSLTRWTAFGYTGVDIFFVISGLIMAHTTRHFDPTGPRTFQAIAFMRRRVERIVPLYWVALLWTIKVPLVNGEFTSNYLLDFLFVPRIHSTGNIWPELIAGWTINYEMFFYVTFSIAMLSGKRRYSVLATILGSLIALGIWVGSSSTLATFYTSPLLAEFLMGVGLYFVAPRIQSAAWVTWLVLVGSFGALTLDNETTPRVIADGLPAVAIVWAGMQLGQGVQIGWLRKIGDASYSIYLFHLGVFSLLHRAIHAWHLNVELMPPGLALALSVAIAVAVGMVIHILLEKPLIRALQRPYRSIPKGQPTAGRQQ